VYNFKQVIFLVRLGQGMVHDRFWAFLVVVAQVLSNELKPPDQLADLQFDVGYNGQHRQKAIECILALPAGHFQFVAHPAY
jgi:hypothetical protein